MLLFSRDIKEPMEPQKYVKEDHSGQREKQLQNLRQEYAVLIGGTVGRLLCLGPGD